MATLEQIQAKLKKLQAQAEANYDDQRARAGLEALATLSEKTQVVFLSHHDHLTSIVREVFGNAVNVVHLDSQ
ncbi:hypothetical protein SAMN05216466_11148 [Paraburkholderia phenazinium]|uniref:Uncharacterized protein n=1 Tax=Paraburkholderia phenazinium TaxID=60549 RepID=A0A1G8DJN7_9BURK|nr:hypothetical protein [Paraburkholderia phenazinium]SDH57689.1 hypothetical protein SAMN05216466_11148 [Paraburkholderia phenazinium]